MHILTILFHLSIYPPSSWHLMTVGKILKSIFSAKLEWGIVTCLRNKSSDFLPLSTYPRKCKGVSSCSIYSTRSPPARTPLPRYTSWTASYSYLLINFTLIRLKYFLLYAPSSAISLIYSPFPSPWWRDWPITMMMLHSLRGRTPMASREKFPPTPSKFLITAPDPSLNPAVRPFPPNRSYSWRRTYSTSLYAANPAGCTTSAAFFVCAPHPFEERTPTALLRPHNERSNPSTERPLFLPLQAHSYP